MIWLMKYSTLASLDNKERLNSMDFKEAKKRAAQLTKEIRYHNELYYNQDAPEISDFEYVALTRELKAI